MGSQAALVPVWFLATYVLVVTIVPLTVAAWDRFGWKAPLTATTVAAAIDFIELGVGYPAVRWLNYLFVWNAVHMLGYAWLDGRKVRAGLVTAAGFSILVALVALGPYPLAMVGLDYAPVTNSNPPKVTLVFLALFQFGIVRLLEARASRMLAGIRTWTAVVAVSGSIMTLYLWHLTAMVALIGGLLLTGGLGLGIEMATPMWWLTRPLWLAVLAVMTLALVTAFGRFERPRPDPRPAPHPLRPVLAAVLSCAGLGFLAAYGAADSAGVNGLALSLPFLGVVAGGLTINRRAPSGS